MQKHLALTTEVQIYNNCAEFACYDKKIAHALVLYYTKLPEENMYWLLYMQIVSYWSGFSTSV